MCESVSIMDDCFTLVTLGAIYHIATVTQMARLARFTWQIYLRASHLIILMQKHHRNNVKFVVAWRMSKTKYIKFSGWHLEILKKGLILFIRWIIVFSCFQNPFIASPVSPEVCKALLSGTQRISAAKFQHHEFPNTWLLQWIPVSPGAFGASLCLT